MQRKSFRLLTLFILLALLSSLVLPAFAQDVKPTDPPPAAPEAAPPSAPLGPIGGYTFANLTGAYADLTGDTPFAINGGSGSLDDGISADQTIPFSFNFGGSVFTTYRVNTNGWLGFGSPTSTTNYSSLNGTVNNVIAFVNRDMDNVGAVYSSVTEGVAPNRIHKIQAKNFYRYTAATNTGNAQIWLYETTNAIEFHYGTFATWTNASGTAQVGLRGASTGVSDVRSLAGTGATAWSSPTAGNLSTATMSLFGTNVPDSGRVYRFEPVVAPNLGTSTKTATPAFVRTGQAINYQLVIKNTGDVTATGATLSDPIPTGASYVAGSVATQGSPAATYNGGTNTVEWGAADLAPSQRVTVTFQVEVTAASGNNVVNTATYNATNASAAVQKTTTTPVVGCVNDASYRCADSLTPGGPTYNWYDATGGTLILDATTSGDDRTAAATLPFPFTFYGTTSSDILVGDNGAIVFNATTGSISFSNTAMSSAPANFIAPFWDDLDTDTGGTYGQVFGTAPNRVYVVEWNNRPHYSNVGAGTFEVLFFEGTNQIAFQYQDVNFGDVLYDNGAGATVGIKGSTIQYSFNVPALSDLLAIQFTPIVPPNANVTPASLASTQLPNAQVTQPLTINNTGEADLNWVVEESTVVNGVALPLARFVDHGSAQPAPVQEFKIGDVGLMPAGTGAGQQVTPQRADTPDSLITISHSLAQSIVQNNSASCNGGSPNFYHTDNSYLRVFDLNAFGISGTFAVTQVEFGIEQALSAGAAGQPLTVNLYIKTNPADPLTFANLTPIGTASVTVADQSLALYTVPVAGTAPAGSVLVVEVFTPNGQTTSNSFFIGSNGAGQTGPSYIAAADCTIPEPATTASIGFPNMHIVMNVTGDASSLAPCAVPGDIPWLAETPTSGATAGGASSTVDVTFDSTGLATGTYSGDLCVSSNDPNPGPGNGTNLVVVPVTLTVQAANAPAITLNKTVGTTPGVCATTNKVTVPYGTEVYYCYQVENTGNVTLDVHSLVDNKLGALVTNLAYELAPGAFSPQVIVPATINITTTNVATWTASTAVPFIDISGTGTGLGLTDDSEANIVSPFPFTFFGSASTDLRVGNNGGILFGVTAGDLGLSNTALPAAAGLPAPAILPFWDDMDDETGNVYWEVQGTAPDRKLIVEWYNRPHFNGVGAATFEAILYETSNAIEFRYLDTDFGNAAYNYGASATSGLQQNTTTAVQHSFNQPVLFGGKAVRFEPSAYTPQVLNLSASDDDFAEVNVTYPNIDVDPLSMSATQATNTTTNQTLNVANTGNAPLTWEIAETQPDRPARAGVQAAPEPVFDVPAAVTSEKDCAAFENYLGTEPDGWAQFCGQPAEAPASSPSNPTSTGYTLNLRTPDRNLKRFTLNNWPGQTVVGAQTANIYALDFDTTATTLYALNTSTNELGTLSTTTGAFTAIVACPAPAGSTWTGLSIDPTTNVFYASTAANLYTLNPATCSPTLIGPFNVTGGIMIDIAVNPAGAMYGHDIFTDSIYTINTSTGAATLVGPTGYAANFAQGMDFDNEDGTLYIFLYIGTGVNHYGTVNLATGAVTALATTNPTGEFEGATQTLGLCIPNDYGWLSTSPITGTTAANSVTPVTVTFDSTALANGVYTGQLCIRSNDPDNGPGNGTSLVQVPVTLTVTVQVNPSIALTKTVGTTSGVCATTDDITVAAGTTVYYCYEVANTGDVTLNLHNLVDDQLGTIFSGLNYALAPGSSVNTVQAGLSIPAVINATTVNTATWTAYNTGGPSVQATDTATVTVQAAGPAINLVKTVGTVPAVCATTDNIVVTAGTPVYYCYQVENTGTVTFNYHDLVDSELGTLLNDFPYTLAPGAFSPQVIVPDTPMVSVTNVATWTATTALAGYTADDTIPYNWQDISGTGTPVTLTDDSVSGALPIGFNFAFFGTGYTDAYASSNGFMTFASGSGNGCCTGQALPNPLAPNNLVAGWWEDLNPSAGGTVHYQTLGTAPNRVFILQFTNIQHYASGNPVTMQYKLFETTNVIEAHYQAAPSDGGTHSAGIENADGTVGVQFYYGTSALTTPEAVQYAPTPVATATDTDTATVTVLTPNIDVNPLSLSSTQPAGTTTTLPMTVANTGQGDLNWQIAEEPTGVAPAPLTGGDASVAADVFDGKAPQQPAGAAPELSDWRAPEAVLYDNGPLVTNPGAGAGGADASALQTALGIGTYGFGNQASAGNRVADDFTVGGSGWLISNITFFGYQTGSTTTSTFTAVNLRIWDGPPNVGTSMVVFGDTTTNRLTSSTWSNMYRVLDTGLLDTARPVMANVVAINTFLPAGTYWLDWQADGSLASGPWAPPVSILGQLGKPGANALQFTTTGWAAVTDPSPGGTPQDFPFIVDGLADCSNLSDVPWLSASPTNGTNTGGTNTPVAVTFDSTGLADGTYTARLCVSSNDPDNGPGNGTGLVIVPVTLTVQPPTAVTLSSLDATQSPAPVPAGLPLAALPAAAGLAMAAVYALRRKVGK